MIRLLNSKRCLIPIKGRVVLSLYDITGRRIRTLIDREKGPGVYEFALEMENLSNGIYFIRMEAGGVNRIEKVILIR